MDTNDELRVELLLKRAAAWVFVMAAVIVQERPVLIFLSSGLLYSNKTPPADFEMPADFSSSFTFCRPTLQMAAVTGLEELQLNTSGSICLVVVDMIERDWREAASAATKRMVEKRAADRNWTETAMTLNMNDLCFG